MKLSIIKKSALNDCFHFQGPTEKEQIDVQGDISYDIVEFITDTWPDVKYLISFFRYYVLVECVCFPILSEFKRQ